MKRRLWALFQFDTLFQLQGKKCGYLALQLDTAMIQQLDTYVMEEKLMQAQLLAKPAVCMHESKSL